MEDEAKTPADRPKRARLDAARMRRKPTVMPEKLVRGDGVPPRLRAQPIRWTVWLALPHLELWQAVALSLKVNPVGELRDEVSRAPSRFSPLRAEFFDRLSDCRGALGFDGPIRPQGSPYRGMLQSPACLVSMAEVAAFLTLAGYELPEQLRDIPPPRAAQVARPQQRQQCQEQEVLQALRELGYDPLALPELKPPRSGPKAAARKKLGSTGMWAGARVFDKAWERLRKSGQIADRG